MRGLNLRKAREGPGQCSQRGRDGLLRCWPLFTGAMIAAIQDIDGAASRASLELEVRIAKQALEPDRRQVAARPITA